MYLDFFHSLSVLKGIMSLNFCFVHILFCITIVVCGKLPSLPKSENTPKNSSLNEKLPCFPKLENTLSANVTNTFRCPTKPRCTKNLRNPTKAPENVKCNNLNEVYMSCGPNCPATCNNQEGKNPDGTLCCSKCVSGCFCSPGFVRSNCGTCIKPEDCNKHTCTNHNTLLPCLTKRCCGKNEFYSPCAPNIPRACDNIGEVLCNRCSPGCACLPGYIKESSTKGAKCIKPCQCPCISRQK